MKQSNGTRNRRWGFFSPKNAKKLPYRTVLILLLLLLLLPVGIYRGCFYTQHADKRTYKPTEGHTATIILIDGLSSHIFQQELAKGKLPNLARLISQSTYVRNGISSFPTMTGYGFYPFITGSDAPQSGILGLRWFDRNRPAGKLRNYVGRTHIHMNEDISPAIPTLFETYKEYYTSSINSYMNKGVNDAQMTGWAHTTAKYEGKGIFGWLRAIPWIGHKIAKNHFEHETDVLDLALQQLEKNPKIQWITFPSPDAYNHVFGTDSTYHLLLRHIDGLIGRFVRRTAELGQDKQRLIAVVSDHGTADVYKNIDFIENLKNETGLQAERGNSVNIWSDKLEESDEVLKNSDAYFVINGNLCGYLYLKNTDETEAAAAWSRKPPHKLVTHYPKNNEIIDLPNKIRFFEGIELVAYRQNDSTLMIANAQGYAQITQITRPQKDSSMSGVYRYDTLTADPLHYAATQQANLIGQALGAQQWLYLTAQNTDFPYAVPRLFEVMRPQTAPDLLFTASKGFDVANDYEIIVHNYKGGHGGLRRDLISVPYILHIPQQQPDTLQVLTNEAAGQIIKQFMMVNN